MVKDYAGGKKVNRIIIADQQGTATTCTVTPKSRTRLLSRSVSRSRNVGKFGKKSRKKSNKKQSKEERKMICKQVNFW